ncbi:MAG: 3-deoxy-manno-octulosonate cytidylyltransferase [Deltaproteobacteria bacterium]|nr:3-deoxy-manno-octulosonate cytidylyltransferase [Deltaproteobacteria bacterium]
MSSASWIVIPARFQARRFPGKPLALLHGRPMLIWVIEACRKVKSAGNVIVATDDQRIAGVVRDYGAQVEMTAGHHQSGTERLAEIAARYPEVKWFVNVQGDEPGIEPQLVERFIALLEERDDPDLLLSAASPLREPDNYRSPHVVKVVVDLKGRALYFSRSPIPFLQDEAAVFPVLSDGPSGVLQHLGLYGYSGRFLRRLTSLRPGVLAAAENLEQLNWLENGYRIEILPCDSPWAGIDTPQELERFAGRWPGYKSDGFC